jgi:GT2 family glycosyltransferase
MPAGNGLTRRYRLTVSVVAFGADRGHLASTLASVAVAGARADVEGSDAVHLVLVDNGPEGDYRSAALSALVDTWPGHAKLISGHGNIGYGRGHNLAIAQANSEYYLVLNPDVQLAADALAQALAFMDSHPDCGLLAPAVRDEGGDLQYLCKRYPSVLDLLLRGFAPSWVRGRFGVRLGRYEMRDLVNESELVWDPAIVSGCFMLFRTEVLEAVGGFDSRYFLYFEDFDLSLRTARVARLAYVPQVRIVHHGGAAARKGPAHVFMFLSSAIKFMRITAGGGRDKVLGHRWGRKSAAPSAAAHGPA